MDKNTKELKELFYWGIIVISLLVSLLPLVIYVNKFDEIVVDSEPTPTNCKFMWVSEEINGDTIEVYRKYECLQEVKQCD